MINKVLLLLLALLVAGSTSAAATGSLTPETLCVCPGDEATFTCSVEGSGGVFAWITNTTAETCQVFSSSPQSQCGQFIGQLQNGSLSTLTATSAATSDTGNILIQCYYTTDLVGNATLLIAGTPPPIPILHNVTSEDIQDNGDGENRNVTLRWTLSEPDDLLNTTHFNVTPDDPTHCGSCEVGPGDPEMQEEFSCQVVQGIGQNCVYRVHAARCGDTQNGVMSEPVEVHVPVAPSSLHPLPATSSSPHPPSVTSSSPHPPSVTSSSPHPPSVTSSSPHPPPVTSSSPHPPPETSSSSHPPPVTSSSSHPPPETSSSLPSTPLVSEDDELSGEVIAAIVVVPLLFLIVIVVLIVLIATLLVWKRRGGSCGANISSDPENKKEKPDEIDLHQQGRPSPEPVDDLPTYADPHEIKREEFPGTEDMYTMPDKKKKTHKPKDHLPTYADPSAIEHETAPATGDLYTVVDKPMRSFRKQPQPPPGGPLQT